MANDGLNVIMFSGTADKFIPLGVLAQSAVNLEKPVRIFVTGWALEGFRKDGFKKITKVPKEYEDLAPALMQGMAEMRAPSWYEMLQSAKEMGDVKIYVCSMMASAFKIDTEHDLDPMVDEVVGAAAFLKMTEGKPVLFI